MLFNVFINDALDESEDRGLGIEVPHLQRPDGEGAEEEDVVSGLLFADDLVALAASKEQLGQQLKAIEDWAKKWEMTCGVRKCGVMVINPNGDGDQRELLLEADAWSLHGEAVPVVSEYTYLGLKFTSTLKMCGMVQDRLDKGRKALFALKNLLQCQAVPIFERMVVLKGIVIPTMLYGAEVWGMSCARVRKMQTLINMGYRWVIGLRGKSTAAASLALWQELGVPSIHTLASARRARAWGKFPLLRTWISTLIENRAPGHGAQGWVRTTGTYVNRFRINVGEEEVKEAGGLGRALYKRAIEVLSAADVRRSKSNAGELYVEAKFSETRPGPGVLRRDPKHQLGRALMTLAQCRVGGFWTAKRRAVARLIGAEYLNRCPFCRSRQAAEDMAHMFLH